MIVSVMKRPESRRKSEVSFVRLKSSKTKFNKLKF